MRKALIDLILVVGAIFVVGVVGVFLFGCAGIAQMSDEWCGTHASAPAARCVGHMPSQSWDQENLKKHDSGCPSGIYDAPGGNLRLCPVS